MASEGSSQSPKTERTPGSIILPLARVKRIIKEDKDVAMVNPEATYCVAYATVRPFIPDKEHDTRPTDRRI